MIVAAVLTLAACQKKETEVKTENTVIEGQADTTSVDTDTVSEAQLPAAEPSVSEPAATEPKTAAAKAPVVEVKAAKEIKTDYASFGDKILADNALSKEAMLKKYNALKSGDTVNVKFKTKIKDVCKKKGCWMALQLPGEKESFVKFKDYAFFVPLNASGQDAVVSGKAFVSEVSVAQLRHYAKDGGKSEAEIAKITEPEITYGFLADGVLISK